MKEDEHGGFGVECGSDEGKVRGGSEGWAAATSHVKVRPRPQAARNLWPATTETPKHRKTPLLVNLTFQVLGCI